jgi:MOSC domain-containing protein YiiM
MASVVSVNVVHRVLPDEHNGTGRTAIDKRPVAGRVAVTALGVDGDQQMDVRHHGGRDKAVYAYATEDAGWWSGQLGRPIAPGQFGENLTTTGLDVTDAVIGERWRIGGPAGLVVEVSMPRTPCATFQAWLGEKRWVRRFTERGAPGAYLRVAEEGGVEAGDGIEVVHRPSHGVTIGDCFVSFDPPVGRRLLEADAAGEIDLAEALRTYAERAAARA